MSKDEANVKEDATVTLRPDDVLHIPGLGYDGVVGYSPIAMAKNAIGMGLACEVASTMILPLIEFNVTFAGIPG